MLAFGSEATSGEGLGRILVCTGRHPGDVLRIASYSIAGDAARLAKKPCRIQYLGQEHVYCRSHNWHRFFFFFFFFFLGGGGGVVLVCFSWAHKKNTTSIYSDPYFRTCPQAFLEELKGERSSSSPHLLRSPSLFLLTKQECPKP